MSKILCVDFDGVLHSYSSGWQGADEVKDAPVKGAIRWLVNMIDSDDGVGYAIAIYSSRSSQEGGIMAMKAWLTHWFHDEFPDTDPEYFLRLLTFPTKKPPAYLTIDDRAICFRGTFPSVQELDYFKPWNK